MEEDEYKSTYGELTSVRCVFEKTLTNHRAKCSLSKHFCLADREGYSCEDTGASLNCAELLEKLRKKSLFVLKLRDINGPLPHNMEIRVQAGGVQGLAKLINAEPDDTVDDISMVLSKAISQFGCLDKLPYSEIIQSVEQFQGRRRRPR